MDYKDEFIKFMIASDVLKFGDFTTKSGRKTPYFINTGNYKTGEQAQKLGEYYAHCLHERISHSEKVVLFGPAYKGIPLILCTSIALFQKYGISVPYCFNRKEVKTHGEGGSLVGYMPKKGDRVFIIEDVITAGTAIRETLPLLQSLEGVTIEGIIVSVDRMEKGKGVLSAINEIERDFSIPVTPIVTIRDIIKKAPMDEACKKKLEKHLSVYGA